MIAPTLDAPARYFPVREAPLRMEAGLHRFGTDFGNGAADSRFFQIDSQRDRYLEAKRSVPSRRHGVLARDADENAAHRAVCAWARTTLALEHPSLAIEGLEGEDPAVFYSRLALAVQEDFVVIRRGPTSAPEAAIGVFVSLPSGWRPERILGTSFREIHGPVPGFADDPAQARAIVASMIGRGPYVRFVWTITPDDHLDRHPEEGGRAPWSPASRGWLRVERQVTVPFPEEDSALFLIRIYLYPFDDLRPVQRATLSRALLAMPAPVARYKAIDERVRTIALARLSAR